MFKKKYSSFPPRRTNNNNKFRDFNRPRQPFMDPFEKDHPRNDAIRADQVRVIDSEGQNIGIMPLSDAITMAKDQELDLVLYAAHANPPVCKIVDWETFKYQVKKKEKEIKKNQKKVKVKEIKISPKIAGTDLDRKVEKIHEIIDKGDQVKITIMRKFPITPDQANAFKDDLLTKLGDSCTIISVQQKGKNIFVLVKSKPVTHAKS